LGGDGRIRYEMAPDRDLDSRILRIAGAQDGHITLSQLTKAGLTRGALRARVERGQLTRAGHGLYAVPLADQLPRATERAAILELGAGAFISHRTAAALWQLVPAQDDAGPVHVTVVAGQRRARPGICLHRVERLEAPDRKRLFGLPVTAPPRALLDYGADATMAQLESALNEARRLRLLTDRTLADALNRAPTRKGSALLRALLSSAPDRGFSRSDAELLLRRLLAQADLPPPEFNRIVEGLEVDAVWRQPRLIVEFDSWEFHRERSAFETDRARDRKLVAAGWRVIRITWRQLCDESVAVATAIALALSRGT
jgi:very-short-patch-repair endonuclease